MREKYILVDVEPEDLGFTVISKKYKKVVDLDKKRIIITACSKKGVKNDTFI